MVSGSTIADRWVALAAESDAERATKMRGILDEVLALGEVERATTVASMVQGEYGLDDAQLRPFTVSRLRTWLAIAAGNLEGAQSLARGYDAAFDKLPAAQAMRRSTIVQTVARMELTPEEVTGLFDLIPSIVRQVPRATQPTRHYDKPGDDKKKPFWRFW
jgi:hypothetical protein